MNNFVNKEQALAEPEEINAVSIGTDGSGAVGTSRNDAMTGPTNILRHGTARGTQSSGSRHKYQNDSSRDAVTSFFPDAIDSSMEEDKPSENGDRMMVVPTMNESRDLPTMDSTMSLDGMVDLERELRDRMRDIQSLSNSHRRDVGSSASLWNYVRDRGSPPGPRMVNRAISHIDQTQNLGIRKLLGTGSFGSVHLASVNGVDRAVKSIRGRVAELEKIVCEAEIGYHMIHPNIVRTFSYQISDDASYNAMVLRNSGIRMEDDVSKLECGEHVFVRIVQELCDIGSLTTCIKSDNFIERHCPALSKIEFCVLVALDVLNALIFLKCHGVLHGDLSGNNVLLSTDDSSPMGMRAKVCDFGRSRLMRMKMMTDSLGTVAYMPPEMALSGEISSQTDIYSLGILMIEMLTNDFVWEGQQPVQILFAMSSGKRVEVPECVPSNMRDFLASCLSDNPDDRPTAEVAFDQLKRMIPVELVQAHMVNVCDPARLQ